MFNDIDSIKKLRWLYDSYRHATEVKEFGAEKGNKLNLATAKEFFRK